MSAWKVANLIKENYCDNRIIKINNNTSDHEELTFHNTFDIIM